MAVRIAKSIERSSFNPSGKKVARGKNSRKLNLAQKMLLVRKMEEELNSLNKKNEKK